MEKLIREFKGRSCFVLQLTDPKNPPLGLVSMPFIAAGDLTDMFCAKSA